MTDLPVKYAVVGTACLVLGMYIFIIFAIPRVIMSTILGKLVKTSGFNKMFRIERSTHESRVVVLPSPDFLYSVIGVDLSDPLDAIRIKAPASEYASLGIYDRNAKCTDIASHAEAKLDAIIVGVNSRQSNAQILSALKKLEGRSVKRSPPQIFRMASVTGLLLHRILIPDPSNYEEYKAKQSLVVSEKISLKREGVEYSSDYYSWLQAVVFVGIVVMSIAVSGAAFPPALPDGFLTSIGITILLCALCSGLSAYVTVRLLKNPKYAGKLNLTRSNTMGSWNFHQLRGNLDMRGINCLMNIHRYLLVDLVTFLHGALGLLPSEVIYGTAITDSDGLLLEYGATYVVTVPTLYLLCQWWSLSLYGHDLFLIPNDKEVYSVNSMQLEQIVKLLRDEDGNSYDRPLRIVCGPDPPSDDPASNTFGHFWIPLPHRPPGENDTELDSEDSPPQLSIRHRISARASAKAPRLVLRVYRPVSADWTNEFQKDLCPTVTRVYPAGKPTRIPKRNFSISSEALVNAI